MSRPNLRQRKKQDKKQEGEDVNLTDSWRVTRPAFSGNDFNSVDEVTAALREGGLKSSNLIFGIGFTKSNEWSGKNSFNRKSLHAIGDGPNPYERAISIIGQTLSPFDEDNLIPCFGFGDATTHDRYVFSFYPDHRACHGLEEALARYREIAPLVKLSGRTSFAPVINAAIDIVEESQGQYHVLVIIADGQVTRPCDLQPWILSLQEEETIRAIVAASHYPLSIVLIGVGDGPWDAIHKFADNIPERYFNNFQFVDFTKIMSGNKFEQKKEAAVALAAVMEILSHCAIIQSLGLNMLGERPIRPRNRPLPPPPKVRDRDNSVQSAPDFASSSSAESNISIEQVLCPVCKTNLRDMAFGCGHLVCKTCGPKFRTCPLCRRPITLRLRLYPWVRFWARDCDEPVHKFHTSCPDGLDLM